MQLVARGDGIENAAAETEHIPEGERQTAWVYPRKGVYVGGGGGYSSGCVLPVCNWL